MKVFISWSGSPSQQLALAIHHWLPLQLHFVDPWMSDADISAGDRWLNVVGKELEDCNFGIVCVTRQNLNSSWLSFEAGSLAKSMEESRVIPLLFNLEFHEIDGPLAQFQAKKVDRNGMAEMVRAINRLADQPVPELYMRELFDALWPRLEGELAAIPKETMEVKPVREPSEILEELVSTVRSLELRMRSLTEREVSQNDSPESAAVDIDYPGLGRTRRTIQNPWALNRTERRTLRLLGEKHSVTQVADELQISLHQANGLISSLMVKTGAQSLPQLRSFAPRQAELDGFSEPKENNNG